MNMDGIRGYCQTRFIATPIYVCRIVKTQYYFMIDKASSSGCLCSELHQIFSITGVLILSRKKYSLTNGILTYSRNTHLLTEYSLTHGIFTHSRNTH